MQASTGTQDARGFGQQHVGMRHMLEHVEEHHGIDRSVDEWQARDVAADDARRAARASVHESARAEIESDYRQVGAVRPECAEERARAAAELEDRPAHALQRFEAVAQAQRAEGRRIER